MVFFSFKKVILLASLAATNARDGIAENVCRSTSKCPSYYMIGARGTGEGPNGSLAYTTLYQKVLSAVPGGAKEELDYSTIVEYSTTVKQGAQTEARFIIETLAKCPQTLFVLLGYSKGAMVQTQALNMKEIPRNRIAAVVLFGNPYFRAGLPQNKCGGNTGMGNVSRSGVRMPSELSDRVYDCCAPRDKVCQSIAHGSNQPHGSYPGRHEDNATQFVIQKLRARLFRPAVVANHPQHP
ncbi:hypothetical protein PGT21_025081 [Puccinia graminis f. sp. tritici]|uniref:Cutinase n=1 Tax=Puccinia graminis f. sp. tritici TaxID=56615 RepID=A0A5B0RP06_PUCGR|nr:hypothetical protein PGT21_025081 [Puccinia graminis f. sp. tritici]KAA1127731.1 hypothetical protein PGTUg99_006621 [Puccinia graminis f. sp. tritici]